MKRVCMLALAGSLLAIAGCGSSKSSSSAAGTSSTTQSSGTSSTTQSSGTSAASTTKPSGGAAASTTKPSGGAAASGGATEDTIKSLAFNPATIHAKVGDTVTWTNLDGPPHNVTWTGGPKFTSSTQLNTNDKFSLKLTQAGTITYKCSIHPFMKAKIVVTK